MTATVSREALTIERIEARRISLGVPDYQLERVAGLAPCTLYQVRTRASHTRPATLASLALALDRLKHGRDCDTSERVRLIDMILRVLTALVCEVEGFDAAEVHAQDPALRATRSPEWAAAAQIRQTVFGLASSALGLTGAQLAAAGGISRAGISHRLHAHEDRRDDAAFDALMDRLERSIRGDL